MSHKRRLFWEPLDSRARERLLTLVGDFKGGDPLAPVSVVVPSTYAGLDLRHELSRHGSTNVHFLVLARLAELLGLVFFGNRSAIVRPIFPTTSVVSHPA